jgi:hypothetical protein
MPDAALNPNGTFRGEWWTYFQAPSAMLLPPADGVLSQTPARPGGLLLFFNGGAPRIPESDWCQVFDPPYPPSVYSRFQHMWTSGQNRIFDSGMFSVIQAPMGWGPEKRHVMTWSATWEGQFGRAYSTWAGLGTAPAISGPWTLRAGAIESVHEVQPNAANTYPPGCWSVALLRIGDRVLAITRDTGAVTSAGEGLGERAHRVYEVASDLTARHSGIIRFDPLRAAQLRAPYTWATDAALTAGGRLLILDGGDPGQAAHRFDLWEYASAGEWTGGDVIVQDTGRRWAHPNKLNTWDGGYLRHPDGRLVEPRLTLASTGWGSDWLHQRGNWRLQFWDEGAYADLYLAKPPLPVEREG